MSETNKSKSKWGATSFIIIVIIIVVKFWLQSEKRESEESSKRMFEMISEFNKKHNSYNALKNRILNLSFNDINEKHRSKNAIAVVYDILIEDSTKFTFAITADSTVSILVPNRENDITRTQNKEILDVSNSILNKLGALKDKMELYTGSEAKLNKGSIRVFIRSNELKTYVKTIKLKDKDLTASVISKSFAKLWKAIRNEQKK